jgi:signal transduction histidine kinase
LLNGGVLLRAVLAYRQDQELGSVLVLLVAYLLLYGLHGLLPGRPSWYRAGYISLQALLIFSLLSWPKRFEEFFAILFAALIAQVAPRHTARQTSLWIGLFALLMLYPLLSNSDLVSALAAALVYTAVGGMMAAYVLTCERARAARGRNRVLEQDLARANRQLSSYADRVRELAVARERIRLARDLHDSVTQTLFSMTLAAKSALVLLDRGGVGAGRQIERLQELSATALAEMRSLVANLRRVTVAQDGLLSALRQHLARRQLQDGLSVSLRVEEPGRLQPVEEESLFHIAQEALNNVAKHAGTMQAEVALNLARPAWLEIRDGGKGFLPESAQAEGHLGLASMRERAEEIGWQLVVASGPGAGTRVRAEQPPGR